MNSSKMLAVVAALVTLLTACSEVPSNSTVEELIKTQYQQDSTVQNEAIDLGDNDLDNNDAGDNNTAHKSFDILVQKSMPTLDSVDNINCDIDESDYTYLCTADITQTMNGHTSINQGSFKIYKADNEWVLDL